ncbi:hypothetical protein PTNB73_04984 [Pyrenophora teres f. teres]|nr:hypothetical protein PTNB73_04984 [Pyrenophora teres f. teres]
MMNKLGSQMASMRLTGHPGFDFIIDLTTPASSPCSSPVSETCDSEYEADDEAGKLEDTAPVPAPTPVQQMISSLPFSGISTLQNYLHHYALTMTDVEALVPAFLHNRILMNKLAENIGYFSVYGSITPAEVEKMLIHILTKGDIHHDLYELTISQVAYFDRQASLQDSRRQSLEHVEHPVQTENKKEMTVKNKKPKKVTKPQTPVIVHKQKHVGYPAGESFAQTRLHNGPGLYDKKKPNICLPKNDTRKVWTKSGATIMGESLAEEKELQWTKTKPDARFLFKEKTSAKIVVRLPPQP